MTDINAGSILSFDHGGRLTITPEDGSAVIVLNIIAGTFSWRPTMRLPLSPDVDRGELGTDVRKGDMTPGGCSFSFKYTSTVDSTELVETLAADSDDQNMIKHTILVEHFTNDAKTIGRSLTFSNAYVASQPDFTAGTDYDQGNASFNTPSAVALAAIAP